MGFVNCGLHFLKRKCTFRQTPSNGTYRGAILYLDLVHTIIELLPDHTPHPPRPICLLPQPSEVGSPRSNLLPAYVIIRPFNIPQVDCILQGHIHIVDTTAVNHRGKACFQGFPRVFHRTEGHIGVRILK